MKCRKRCEARNVDDGGRDEGTMCATDKSAVEEGGVEGGSGRVRVRARRLVVVRGMGRGRGYLCREEGE
jgi:hypothetical protein